MRKISATMLLILGCAYSPTREPLETYRFPEATAECLVVRDNAKPSEDDPEHVFLEEASCDGHLMLYRQDVNKLTRNGWTHYYIDCQVKLSSTRSPIVRNFFFLEDRESGLKTNVFARYWLNQIEAMMQLPPDQHRQTYCGQQPVKLSPRDFSPTLAASMAESDGYIPTDKAYRVFKKAVRLERARHCRGSSQELALAKQEAIASLKLLKDLK